MGVFSAMTTALSGLRAQSYALENISGNIANSRTTGFKRMDTGFIDLIPDAPNNRELAGSVLSRSVATNSVQGDIAATSIDTNIALNGDGFFIVAERQNAVAGLPTFTQRDLYTRRGDFDFDANGYLVNGAGYYLKGQMLDPLTGNPTGSGADVIRITNDQLPARRTTQIEYRANLPSYPVTTASDPTVAGSELLGPATLYPASPASLATIAASDEATFLARSIQGGAITVYDSLGQPLTMQTAWAKTASSASGGTDTWSLYVLSNPAATGAEARWTAFSTPFTFNGSGQLTSAPTVPVPDLTINGVTVSGLTLTTGEGGTGLTQFSDQNGQLQANSIRQDGYASGVLERTTVSQDGRIIGSYSNGQVVPLAQLLTARFSSPNSLGRLDGGAFEQTMESGLPLIGSGSTQMVGGAIEQSNSDIAEEFSKMIVTQQAYSANTRVITTSQQMLSDILNIVR